MKTIAIIGGMGPQASLHAQNRLQEKLQIANKKANIVHVSLNIDPFFSTEPKLRLTRKQKTLLQNINADVGFIACNTAHYFFDDFQRHIRFKLLNILTVNNFAKNSTVICSPTSRAIKLFGENMSYLDDERTAIIEKMISDINRNISFDGSQLKNIVSELRSPVFACTEISLIAHAEKLFGHDTLEVLIDKVIDEISGRENR